MHSFPSMWAYGYNFCTEDVDDGHVSQEYRVEVEFNQSSHAIHRIRNLIRGMLDYAGKIHEIIQVDF